MKLRSSSGRVWGLLCMVFAASSLGAECESATPLTRACPGAAVASEKFFIQGSCTGAGVIEVSVGTAGQCAITLTEAEGVGLPTTGTFSALAGASSYVLAQGNWGLQPPTTGMLGDNGGLTCTTGTPGSGGALTMTCNITTCDYVGEDLEPTCVNAGMCEELLTPVSLDAAISGPPLDAGVDATVDSAPSAADSGPLHTTG